MALTTRLFTALDTVNVWELLNEVKGWVDTLASSGTSARFWVGYHATKTLLDGRNVSVAMSSQVESVGGVAPAWDGDNFKLPAGRYRIDVQVRFNQSAGGYRTLSLLKNPGVTSYNSTTSPPGTYLRSGQFASSSNDTTAQATWIGTLAATDSVMIVVRQTSGASTDLVGTPQDSALMIERLGD